MSDTRKRRTNGTAMGWCIDCEVWVLPTKTVNHRDHLMQDGPPPADDNDSSSSSAHFSNGGEIDDAEEVGHTYDVELSYTVDYRFKVHAWGEHQAKERAEEMKYDAVPTDEMHVHTETRKRGTIYADDRRLPDDYDPYGSEHLHDAIESDGKS